MRFLRVIFISLIFPAFAVAQQQTPKNIIVFIADGGGYNQMMCTDYYLYGEYPKSPMASFPVQLAMSTYNGSLESKGATCYNSRLFWSDFNYGMAGYTESAASATAMGTGYKTHNYQVGVDLNGNAITNVVEIAHSKGKKTGVVTTVPFCHATPAGFSTHSKSRKGFTAISHQMIFGGQLDVVAGAGHPFYDDSGRKLLKADYRNIDSLTYEYMLSPEGMGHWTFSDKRKDLQNWAFNAKASVPSSLFFLAPCASTLSQRREGISLQPYDIPVNPQIPTLAEMSLAAIKVLQPDKDGFFLMIEGGATDWANHGNELPRLIEEYIGFYNAVDSVMQYLKKNNLLDETLVIVTSDHECGYLWGNGSGLEGRIFPSNNGQGKMPEAQYFSTDHSNSLVPFFATGPASDIFYSLADETDSMRGAYLTNSEIALTVKMLWGNTTLIFEPDPMQNDKIELAVTLPCPTATIRWFANGKQIADASTAQFLVDKTVYSPATRFCCEVTCGENVFHTPEYSFQYE